MQTLQELSAQTQDADSPEAACRSAVEVLAKNPADVPFVVLYLLADDGKQASLAAATGIDPAAVPRVIDVSGGEPAWSAVTAGLPGRVQALPVARPGESRRAGMLLAATSPRLNLDAKYRSFLELVAGQIATSVASARALEAAKARAEALAEIDRAKTAFFGNVSHEFRTPLTLILGPAQDALKNADQLSPHDVQRWQLVERNAQRLLKLVNTLLDFSRIEAGRVQASYEPADLALLTGDLASLFRSAIEAAGLRLRLQIEALGEPVYVDREMWEKIVLNLLSNALKFTFEGEILVALRRNGDRAELRIRDTGTESACRCADYRQMAP
jgi:signal transduction histidine kinase